MFLIRPILMGPTVDPNEMYCHVDQNTLCLWCSVVECLEHLVHSVRCFPSYCLLTPLMSPEDKKGILID